MACLLAGGLGVVGMATMEEREMSELEKAMDDYKRDTALTEREADAFVAGWEAGESSMRAELATLRRENGEDCKALAERVAELEVRLEHARAESLGRDLKVTESVAKLEQGLTDVRGASEECDMTIEDWIEDLEQRLGVER